MVTENNSFAISLLESERCEACLQTAAQLSNLLENDVIMDTLMMRSQLDKLHNNMKMLRNTDADDYSRIQQLLEVIDWQWAEAIRNFHSFAESMNAAQSAFGQLYK